MCGVVFVLHESAVVSIGLGHRLSCSDSGLIGLTAYIHVTYTSTYYSSKHIYSTT